MPYFRFLAANVCGGILWATGITFLIWFLGAAAEKWMSRASWIALVAATLVGLLVTLLIRRKTSALVRQAEAEVEAEAEAEAEAEDLPADEEGRPVGGRRGARRLALVRG
jgi:flagellar biosynthesis/type III secretory pathway M-ring protein FliF/YscJ